MAQKFLSFLFLAAFIFSQFFFFYLFVQKGFPAYATALAPGKMPPFQVAETASMPLRAQAYYWNDQPFVLMKAAFVWPLPVLGILSGLGVGLTTLVLLFLDKIFLLICLVVLDLMLLLSPVVSICIPFIWRKTRNNSLIWMGFLSLAATLLMVQSVFMNLSPYGWRASLFLGVGSFLREVDTLYQVITFYLGGVLFPLMALWVDVRFFKKMKELARGSRPSSAD